MSGLEPSLHMWLTLAIIAAAIVAFASERISLELASLAVLIAVLLLFELAPLLDPATGEPVLDATDILAGIGDPALIAVLALLVVGQGVVQTGAMEVAVRRVLALRRHHPTLAIFATLLVVMLLSAVLNNTPVVVIFIPLMTALADRLHRPPSSVMMPLSFAAILGGMTTLIGSSTNLLASAAAVTAGLAPIGFFDFIVPGSLLAAIGIFYIAFIAPRFLRDRQTLAGEMASGGEGKQFIIQIEVPTVSSLIGAKAVAGTFRALPDITVRFIQRNERVILPPYDDIEIQAGDVLILGATRKALMDAVTHTQDLLPSLLVSRSQDGQDDTDQSPPVRDQMMAEVVVAPASRMIGRNLQQIGFHYQTHCTVLGVQRRSRMIRTNMMNEIRIEAGDVLLILGHREDMFRLRSNPDVLLLEWSTRELPAVALAQRALAIFAGVVIAASTGIVPIVIAAMGGAILMVVSGCLNIFQASRAIDRRIVMLVWAALALGTALQATGGAGYLARQMVAALDGASPAIILSGFFLLVAVATNVLSNNATAVLFTPIAVGIATEIGVPPTAFVHAVILAANCSFATPIGYQTNLLVLGPGHYVFADFMRIGGPLVVILWLAFSLTAPFLYGL
ncbi:SLC13 family permease [Oceanibacterium hippocampi]|uniref:Sodium-dependent dicarboxylate transporter SdcS n=1 Tax=Oceanibacterium hippocampi TaxID=745714 RepID=A0A1Y5SQP0_9PROT|nr:SLC13 family permease [Oceanibacterium hippocampi]SLN44416.1 Sodium-dependent dicarboxylate transporter SdcS [Oceanibacterium hippocampi]